jgi:AcrR family transcriptional regulator
MARTGRRPGRSETREAIAAAAREHFAQRGYEGTTIRGVAGTAGVDPALVMHFFGTKDGLFAGAVGFPFDPDEALPGVLAGDPDSRGERIVGFFLDTWDAGGGASPVMALLRAATSRDEAAELLRDFLTRKLLARLAAAGDESAPALRADLVASQMVGLAMVRYVLRFEPLASADRATVIAWVAPTVQRYLAGEPPDG